MSRFVTSNAAILRITLFFSGGSVKVAQAEGLQAEMRSSAALLPIGTPGAFAPVFAACRATWTKFAP
jgi:hypothetical protein